MTREILQIKAGKKKKKSQQVKVWTGAEDVDGRLGEDCLSSVIPAVTSPRLSPKRLCVECWRSQAASVHPRTQHPRSRGSTFC